MKNKEKLLTKIEKLAAPMMIVSETHAITLVILVLGVVSFIPMHLLVPTFVRMFVNEGILLLLVAWFMAIVQLKQAQWGIFCCVSMWVVAGFSIAYIHAVTGHMFEGAGFWDPRRMFFTVVASIAYFGNMDSTRTFPVASGLSGKDLQNKGNQDRQN
jgi:hypothetical protein